MNYSKLSLSFVLLILYSFTLSAQKVQVWLTNADRSALFQKQKQVLRFQKVQSKLPVIKVDVDTTFQSIDGFGFALTGGSAQAIIKMGQSARTVLLKQLFDTSDDHIGISYLRVSIGSSDLNDHVFSYDDIPTGQTDPGLLKFDLGADKDDVIPVLKEILAINPKIKILGSPWSAPVWMKTNDDTRGGSLKPEYYQAYARYFVKYIKSMRANGILIDAITVQNEPLHPGNNPSMYMPAASQATFVKTYLGPVFHSSAVKTKIIIYDHNADRPDYPDSVLNDPEASKFIDGSAFHLYRGKIEALTSLHNLHPDKNLYFTEQMVIERGEGSQLNVSAPTERLIIGATRNWCRNVLEWNLAADPENRPFTDRGGCSICQGAITIDHDQVKQNVAYYVMAHASKFVRPGSTRIASNVVNGLPNVAFKTPDGKKVLIVTNNTSATQSVEISYIDKAFSTSLKAGSVATYIWN